MKKKMFQITIAAVLVLLLTACGGKSNSNENGKSSAPKSPPDLAGEWKQTNSSSEESWQSATINGDTIEVYWVTDSGDMTSLYWAGSFEAPNSADDPYSWNSKNDHSKTDMSLLASVDDSKEFTYENGEISYSVSALGTTSTVKLEKEN